uniref:Uncharacterized protein n=1 Tax=Anguilla anguilla TaxID=7936 RepID=A0A0E9QAM7_ANGAN
MSISDKIMPVCSTVHGLYTSEPLLHDSVMVKNTRIVFTVNSLHENVQKTGGLN